MKKIKKTQFILNYFNHRIKKTYSTQWMNLNLNLI